MRALTYCFDKGRSGENRVGPLKRRVQRSRKSNEDGEASEDIEMTLELTVRSELGENQPLAGRHLSGDENCRSRCWRGTKNGDRRRAAPAGGGSTERIGRAWGSASASLRECSTRRFQVVDPQRSATWEVREVRSAAESAAADRFCGAGSIGAVIDGIRRHVCADDLDAAAIDAVMAETPNALGDGPNAAGVRSSA